MDGVRRRDVTRQAQVDESPVARARPVEVTHEGRRLAIQWKKDEAGSYHSADDRFELDRMADGQWYLVDTRTGGQFYSWLKRDCQIKADTWERHGHKKASRETDDEEDPPDEATQRYLAFSKLKKAKQVNVLRFSEQPIAVQEVLLEWAEWLEDDWAKAFIEEIAEGEYDAYLERIQVAVEQRKAQKRRRR